jgi:hypothetical protein
MADRFKNGDKRVDLCACGKFFTKVVTHARSLYSGPLTYSKCQSCRRDDLRGYHVPKKKAKEIDQDIPVSLEVRLGQGRGGSGGKYFKDPNGYPITRKKIIQLIKEREVIFPGGTEDLELIQCLRSLEENGTNTVLLSRIIRAGGLIAYIKFLEERRP